MNVLKDRNRYRVDGKECDDCPKDEDAKVYRSLKGLKGEDAVRTTRLLFLRGWGSWGVPYLSAGEESGPFRICVLAGGS